MKQSIVVRPTGDGRDAAQAIDRYLTGDSGYSSSLRTAKPPLCRH